MLPVEPTLHEGAFRVTYAKDQPDYISLPASVDAQGTVMTEWELCAEDLERVLHGGRIRLWLLHTGVERGALLTPIKMETVDA